MTLFNMNFIDSADLFILVVLDINGDVCAFSSYLSLVG